MSVKMRQLVEREIATAIVSALISAGYRLSTDYGDGESAVFSNKADILKAMFQGDEDRLYVYNNNLDRNKVLGWAYLVYGNDGWDVLSDYTVSLEKLIGDGTTVDKISQKYAD